MQATTWTSTSLGKKKGREMKDEIHEPLRPNGMLVRASGYHMLLADA